MKRGIAEQRYTMRIIPVLLMLFVLTACSDAEKKVVGHYEKQPSIEQPAPKKIVRTEEADSTAVPQLTKGQNEQYQQVVTQYTANMNEVITEMTTTMNVHTAQKQYDKAETYIAQYEQQKKKTPRSSELKEVEQTIDEANVKYLGAMKEIVQGIEQQDEEKKNNGFRSFSQAHQYFNAASFTMASAVDDTTEMPATDIPSTEQRVEKEVYSAETHSAK